MKKSLLSALCLIALFGNSFAQTKKKLIRSVVVVFNTTSNDKDHDTYLDVSLSQHDYSDNADYYMAKKDGIGGHWNNNSSNTVTLDLAGNYDLENYKNAFMKLHISPNGNDKWEFNYTVRITYEDESGNSKTLTKDYNGKVLTQDNTDCSDPIF
ncbi:MAG: hypothetical protein ABJA78_17855 [Ferruginibacter sp.]